MNFVYLIITLSDAILYLYYSFFHEKQGGLHLQLHNLNDGNLLSVNVFLNKISIYSTCLLVYSFSERQTILRRREIFVYFAQDLNVIFRSLFFVPLVNESFLLRIYDIFMQKVIVRNVKAGKRSMPDFKFC